ncbi:MAG: DUF2251 domain-containing protein [Proteobacteria bacterium]|nr:MAG: DUF2251 domain-containing protein [Pseudomonadota bacterium]
MGCCASPGRVDSVRSDGDYGVVFEDDGETGYFYAVDMQDGQKPIDALHIYDVDHVVGREKPSKIQLVWTDSGTIASLLINGYCHALYDFKRRLSYCRNGFLEAGSGWATNPDRKLDDTLIESLLLEDGA